MTENTDSKQPGEKPWQFQPGQSGNPAGKPRGARHKTTLAVQALLDGEAETITRKVIEAAKSGDMAAIRLVLERILPARKDAPISLSLPQVNSIEDIAISMAAVMQAVGNGELTPQEGQAVASLLEQQRKCMETSVLERKLESFQSILTSRKKL